MSSTFEPKTDLRALAETIKANATVTGNIAVAKNDVYLGVIAEAGLTPEQVMALRRADALVANAATLAGGEMGLTHFTNNPNDTMFSLTVPGVGRDQFDASFKHHGTVNIPANKATGTEAREEQRALMVGSSRWTHHGERTAAEFTAIKHHLNQIGSPLLAALAKNNQ